MTDCELLNEEVIPLEEVISTDLSNAITDSNEAILKAVISNESSTWSDLVACASFYYCKTKDVISALHPKFLKHFPTRERALANRLAIKRAILSGFPVMERSNFLAVQALKKYRSAEHPELALARTRTTKTRNRLNYVFTLLMNDIFGDETVVHFGVATEDGESTEGK
jgi:hypothetical protein